MKQLINILSFLSILFIVFSCGNDDTISTAETETDLNTETEELTTDTVNEEPATNTSEENTLYFPNIDSDAWDTITTNSLNWNDNNLDALYTHLEDNDTRAFIILKDGKIVIEKYFGLKATGIDSFDKDSNWYWASAGKTVISLAVGLAQQQGHLNINSKTSDYLGDWTNLTEEKEDLITVKHQLTMTTGLDYDVTDENCTDQECLNYSKDAGDEWYYYNAPYILLRDVISNATEQDYKTYIKDNIEDKIGMTSPFWFGSENITLYWSTARDMARFGLLVLNEGTWDGNKILTDSNYLNEMTTTSQELNDAYGYLWWLNGKDSMIFPSNPSTFNIELASNAPDDLIAAIGKNGQFIDVVPSQNLVVIRMGEAPDGALVPTIFHNEMWGYINNVIN